MLAGGCAARGVTVQVYGPAATGAGLARAAGAEPGWDFSVVDIADGPRPARDLAAVLRLRRLVARDTPDVLHAHGLRAGALAALALAGPGTPRTALAVTVHNAPPAAGPGRRRVRRAGADRRPPGGRGAHGVRRPGGRMRRRGARLAGRALVPAPATPAASAAEIAALRREFAGGESGAMNRRPRIANRESGDRESGAPGSPGDRKSWSGSAGWPRRRVSAR